MDVGLDSAVIFRPVKLEDVDFTGLRPRRIATILVDSRAEHPERRPRALAVRELDACCYLAVGPGALIGGI